MSSQIHKPANRTRKPNVHMPGWKLLNRFRFPVKFGITGAFMAIPMVMATSLYTIEINRDMTFAEKELRGVNAIGQVLEIQKIVLGINSSFQNHNGVSATAGIVPNEVSEQLEKTFADLLKYILNDDTRLIASNQLREIRAEFLNFRQQSATLPQQKRWERLKTIRIHLLTLLRSITDSSKLILDPDLDSYYVMHVLTHLLPDYSDLLAEFNPSDARLTNQDAPPVFTPESKRSLQDRISRQAALIRESLVEKAFLKEYNPSGVLERRLTTAHDAFQRLNREVTSSMDSPKGDLVNTAQAALDETFRFSDHLSIELRYLLQDRIDNLSTRRNWLLAINILAVVAAVYMKIGLYASIRQAICKIRETSGEWCKGDLTRELVLQTSDELGEISRSFNSVAQVLKRELEVSRSVNELKSQFIAGVSHEIRIPLTTLVGYTDMLIENSFKLDSPKKQTFALNTIQRSAQSIVEIITDLMYLHVMDTDKSIIPLQQTSVRNLVSDLENIIRIRCRSKGINLRVSIADSMPDQILTDPTRLKRILLNLFSNSLKFTESGEIWLNVRSSADRCGQLEIEVGDTGKGIDPEVAKRILTPFNTDSEISFEETKGKCLGLAVVSRCARLLGGNLELVSSTPGVGTTFRVTIATGHEQVADLLSNKSESCPTHSDPQSNDESDRHLQRLPKDLRVLLAEDSEENRLMLNYLLEKFGAKIVNVENGRQAIEAVAKSSPSDPDFDCILMDMEMPEMDGYGAAREIRAYGYPGLIIAVTANGMLGDREKCLAAGCNDYILKPIHPRQLISCILSNLSVHAPG